MVATKHKSGTLKRFTSSELWGWVVLLLSLSLTYELWRESHNKLEQSLHSYFEFRAKETVELIDHRLDAYTQVMRGGLGLFNASTYVDRQEFHAYAESLHLDVQYPGIQGLGYAVIVPKKDKDQHTEDIRKEGFPDYAIYPDNNPGYYTSVIYLEPFEDRNLRAFGYDMFSESVRRIAMERARDNDEISLSGMVRLVQETEEQGQAGFLMYLPVYKKGLPHATVEQRRTNIHSWIYTVYRMDDLLEGIGGERSGDIDIAIYDGTNISPKTKMSRHGQVRSATILNDFHYSHNLNIAGHSFTIVINALPSLLSRQNATEPRIITITGVTLSFLLFFIIKVLIRAKIGAERLAESENRFRLMFEQTADAWLLLDPKLSLFTSGNAATAEMLGFKEDTLIYPLHPAELSPEYQPDGRNSKEKAEEMIKIAIQNKSHRFEWAHCSKYREDFPVEVLLSLIKIDQKDMLIVVWRDLSKLKQAEKITQETSERLTNALNAGLMGTWNVNLRTGIDTRDAPLNKLIGLSEKSSTQPVEDWFKYVHPDDADEMNLAWEQAINSESGLYETEHRLIRKDGKVIWVYDRGQMIRDGNGQVEYAVGAVVDITTRKESQEKLQLSSRVFNSTSEGITITDANKVIIDINPAFSDITGYSREEAIGQNPSILSSGKQSPEFYKEMWQKINEEGHWQGEIWNRKKSGEVYAELLTISSLKDAKGNITNYVGVFTDITHSKLQQDDIKKMAHYDALTNLPNRTLLIDRFNQAIAHSKRADTLLAVCFLDLDDFKPVNDTFGHNAGDKLLIEVAHRLESAVRDEDTVSRLGGDEFSFLLGDIKSTTQCYELLERIIQSISATYVIDEQPINISASVGVSIYPLDDVELDVLLRHADQAMYQAKQEGKNSYQFFDVDEAQKIANKQRQLQEIQHALINNELCMYYQPKVNMVSGDIIGVEALIRWQHPDKGLIPPIEFLPILDDTELELQIGEWVIDQGLTQLELLNDHDIEIEVSVNVSSNQFLNASFFGDLNDALDQHRNIDSRYFQLEVLESSALGNLDQINHIIKACRNELGVSIALDDFGTGYSSLSHLSKLPADTIKIDQGFVRDVLDDPNDFAIIDGVVGLASSFNKKLIAEGVETTEHGLMLLLMGCNDAQGYAISRPMPASELVDWIKDYSPNTRWIERGQEDLTFKVRRVKQLELMLTHWLKNVEQLLQNDSEEPIEMSHVNCHFGRWLRRLRQDELFKDAWLDQLQQAHDVMHFVAKELVDAHQSGTSPTREESDRLHTAFEKTLNIMEQEQDQ